MDALITRGETASRLIHSFTFLTEAPIAKNRNTYAKRQREQEKKERADRKRAKRDQKKEPLPPTVLPGGLPDDPAEPGLLN